jgi:hypothetical protein
MSFACSGKKWGEFEATAAPTKKWGDVADVVGE